MGDLVSDHFGAGPGSVNLACVPSAVGHLFFGPVLFVADAAPTASFELDGRLGDDNCTASAEIGAFPMSC